MTAQPVLITTPTGESRWVYCLPAPFPRTVTTQAVPADNRGYPSQSHRDAGSHATDVSGTSAVPTATGDASARHDAASSDTEHKSPPTSPGSASDPLAQLPAGSAYVSLRQREGASSDDSKGAEPPARPGGSAASRSSDVPSPIAAAGGSGNGDWVSADYMLRSDQPQPPSPMQAALEATEGSARSECNSTEHEADTSQTSVNPLLLVRPGNRTVLQVSGPSVGGSAGLGLGHDDGPSDGAADGVGADSVMPPALRAYVASATVSSPVFMPTPPVSPRSFYMAMRGGQPGKLSVAPGVAVAVAPPTLPAPSDLVGSDSHGSGQRTLGSSRAHGVVSGGTRHSLEEAVDDARRPEGDGRVADVSDGSGTMDVDVDSVSMTTGTGDDEAHVHSYGDLGVSSDVDDGGAVDDGVDGDAGADGGDGGGGGALMLSMEEDDFQVEEILSRFGGGTRVELAAEVVQ